MNDPSDAQPPMPARRLSGGIESCDFRHGVQQAGDGEIAQCRLLQEITGAAADRFSTVPWAACQACVETFPPTAQDLNPVVASLLLAAAEQILADGGADGCDQSRARMLIDRAEECLPIVEPGDDDCASR